MAFPASYGYDALRAYRKGEVDEPEALLMAAAVATAARWRAGWPERTIRVACVGFPGGDRCILTIAKIPKVEIAPGTMPWRRE